MCDFDGGRLARRNPPLPLPGASVRFGSRAIGVESVPLAAGEGASPSTGLASALMQKTSEAAIIGKMSTYYDRYIGEGAFGNPLSTLQR